MAFLRDIFTKARKIDDLTSRYDLLEERYQALQNDYGRLEAKYDLAEKAIKSERASKDRFMLRYCDQMSERQRNSGLFTKDAEPKVIAPVIDVLSVEEEAQIQYAAEMMRQTDLDANIEAPPIEKYIEIVRKNPSHYILN